MGAFGGYKAFGGFSNVQKEQAPDSEAPIILTSATPIDGEGPILDEVKKKSGKPISTYEDRVTPIKYAGMVLGGLYHMNYTNFQHDPKPFALILSQFDSTHGNFRAINLHYLPPKVQMDLILKVLYMNTGLINNGKPLNLQYEMFKSILRTTGNYIPFRNYKPFHIKDAKYVPMDQWVNHTKNTRTILPK